MKIKELTLFTGMDVYILFCKSDELLEWLKGKLSPDRFEKMNLNPSKMLGLNGGLIEGSRISQYVWVSSDTERTIPELMGTLAHETSHYLDAIDLHFTGKDEKIPTEIRSRMIQTVVQAGAEMILGCVNKQEQ